MSIKHTILVLGIEVAMPSFGYAEALFPARSVELVRR
jgi:hypothetical protein